MKKKKLSHATTMNIWQSWIASLDLEKIKGNYHSLKNYMTINILVMEQILFIDLNLAKTDRTYEAFNVNQTFIF